MLWAAAGSGGNADTQSLRTHLKDKGHVKSFEFLEKQPGWPDLGQVPRALDQGQIGLPV